MSALTNYLEEQIGAHLFRTATWIKPIQLYVGLIRITTDGEAASVTEVVGGDYARVDVGPDDALWTPPSAGNKRFSNAAAITFPAPTADWHVGSDPITHFGLWDAATGGILQAVAPLTVARYIYGTDPAPVFDIGALRLQFTGVATDYLVQQIGDHLLRTNSWDKPTELHIGLTVAGAEVTAVDYLRKLLGPGDAAWTAPTAGNGQHTNVTAVSWASPTNNWGTVDGMGIWDASTVGNKLISIPTTPKALNTGVLPPNFPIGGLAISLA